MASKHSKKKKRSGPKAAQKALQEINSLIRKARATVASKSVSPSLIENRVTFMLMEVQAILREKGQILKKHPDFSKSTILEQMAKVQHDGYIKAIPLYIKEAEGLFKQLRGDLRSINAASKGVDDADDSYAKGVKAFRSAVRCYSLAMELKATVTNDEVIRKKMRSLLTEANAFLFPVVDVSLAVGRTKKKDLSRVLDTMVQQAQAEVFGGMDPFSLPKEEANAGNA